LRLPLHSSTSAGPVTFSAYVDAFYGWQFHRPVDHTVFPTSVAPRHNEVGLNLARAGVELTGLDDPIGRLFLQCGTSRKGVRAALPRRPVTRRRRGIRASRPLWNSAIIEATHTQGASIQYSPDTLEWLLAAA
jgi:hypothetical protein